MQLNTENTYTHSHSHILIHTQPRTCTRAHTYAYAHTYTYTRARVFIYVYLSSHIICKCTLLKKLKHIKAQNRNLCRMILSYVKPLEHLKHKVK